MNRGVDLRDPNRTPRRLVQGVSVVGHADLTDALDLDPGYYARTRAIVASKSFTYFYSPTGDLHPGPAWATLQGFMQRVMWAADRHCPEYVAGEAYLRVVDASEPDTEGRWHRDNEVPGGAWRFTAAVSSDDYPVGQVFATDDTAPMAGSGALTFDRVIHVRPDSHVFGSPHWVQPANGEIVMFRTELHAVLPTPPRPGYRTAVAFATLYRSFDDVDETSRCHKPEGEPHPYMAGLSQIPAVRVRG